jgi:hypothetical protein
MVVLGRCTGRSTRCAGRCSGNKWLGVQAGVLAYKARCTGRCTGLIGPVCGALQAKFARCTGCVRA